MKKPAPNVTAAQSASAGPWKIIAAISLLLNAALLWLVLLPVSKPPAAPTPAASAAPAIAAPNALLYHSRELAPYAALGSFMAENNRIADLGWNQEQFTAFLDGFRASYEGRGLPLDDAARHLRDDISRKVQSMLATEQPDPVEEYFRNLREKEKVVRTPSNLHYRVTEPGNGPMAKAKDMVIISYSASLPDGHKVPSIAGTRVKIVVQDLLPGLAEGVQLLHVGGKALVYIPPALSFPEDKWPAEIPKGMPLVVFVELHDVVGAN